MNKKQTILRKIARNWKYMNKNTKLNMEKLRRELCKPMPLRTEFRTNLFGEFDETINLPDISIIGSKGKIWRKLV